MLHTLNYYFDLSELNKSEEEEITNDLRENANRKYFNKEGITISRNENNKYRNLIFIRIDLTKLLNTFDIKNYHYDETINKLEVFLENELGLEYNDITLVRVDYRFDVKLEKEVREFFLDIYQRKVIKKYAHKKKQNVKKTTMYMNNKSTSLIIYDKEEERKNKKQKIKDEEKDVLRFEVSVKNKHLNYQKRKGLLKDLINYFDEYMKKMYFKNNFEKILHKGDYYKIYEARKILEKEIKNEKLKNNVDKFLVDISRSSISTVKEKYSKYYYRKYSNVLEKLNINPLLIPKNAKVPNVIKNPLNNI